MATVVIDSGAKLAPADTRAIAWAVQCMLVNNYDKIATKLIAQVGAHQMHACSRAIAAPFMTIPVSIA